MNVVEVFFDKQPNFLRSRKMWGIDPVLKRKPKYVTPCHDYVTRRVMRVATRYLLCKSGHMMGTGIAVWLVVHQPAVVRTGGKFQATDAHIHVE
jgi:hypothetical protein